MNRFLENLKKQAQENPVLALAAAAAVLTATSKLMQANNERSNSRTYRLETERRIRNSR